MQSDIYNKLAELAKKKKYSTYKYTNELLESALAIEESGISLNDAKDDIIIMEKLYKYKGRIIIVPFATLLNTTQNQWTDLGRGLGLLIRQISQEKDNQITMFISIIKFLFSLVGDIIINNNKLIISFPFYSLDIQNKLIASARETINTIISASSIPANINEEEGQIKIEIINNN